MNEYELFVGNPELKNYLRYNGTLRYSGTSANVGLLLSIRHLKLFLTKTILSIAMTPTEIHSFSNLLMEEVACGRNSEVVFRLCHYSAKKLFFRALGIYDHTNIDVGEKKSYNSFSGLVAFIGEIRDGMFI